MITSTEAHICVANIEASCDFYSQKLGFTVAFIYGNAPFFAQVVRDNAKLNLRQVGEPVFAGDIREREQLLSASFTVSSAEEIERFFATCQTAGVTFHQPLLRQTWGATTFIVRDPDGNLILFAATSNQPVSPRFQIS